MLVLFSSRVTQSTLAISLLAGHGRCSCPLAGSRQRHRRPLQHYDALPTYAQLCVVCDLLSTRIVAVITTSRGCRRQVGRPAKHRSWTAGWTRQIRRYSLLGSRCRPLPRCVFAQDVAAASGSSLDADIWRHIVPLRSRIRSALSKGQATAHPMTLGLSARSHYRAR